MLNKKSILKKTIEVGGSTFASRCLGIIREILLVRFLGASALSDAFLTAFKIPNSLRKIFAEGALSAAFIPTIVQTVRKQGREAVNSLMSLAFIVFEGIVLFLCVLTSMYAHNVIRFIAPGFSEQQIADAVPLLKILMPFIFFISSSALLAGALQSVGHFFIPAFGPVLLNIVFITGLLFCLGYNLPIEILCWFILFGGFLLFVAHLVTYFKHHFKFSPIKREDVKLFGTVFAKFAACLPSVSIMEVSLFIDTSFASLLPKGSISLLYYANRFMGIPLGVFAVAFSTILLPHFSRVSAYAPKRLSFYLFEATKFVLWVTIPVALVMGLFKDQIFLTLFLSKKFTLSQVHEAATILVPFLAGLFFFSINKILLNVYYSLHCTWVPAIIAACATVANIMLNYFFIHWLQATGLAAATAISAVIQTILFFIILKKKFNFKMYFAALIDFMWRYAIQLFLFFIPFRFLYYFIFSQLKNLPEWWASLLLFKLPFWLWACPLAGLFFVCLYLFKKPFGVRLYFLD